MKKKIKIFVAFIIILALFLFNQCTNESEENLLRGKVCDTLNLTYSKDIQSIFKANCYVCHDHNLKSGGFDIENFNEIVKRLDSRLLINVISHEPGYLMMPLNRAKLDNCTIKKISLWNNAGHPQN